MRPDTLLAVEHELPLGWIEAPLVEVAEINPKGRFEAVDNNTIVSFIPMAALPEETGRIDLSVERPFSEISKGYTRFREGDVIFAKITPCMENGKIAVARGLKNGLACGSTEFHVLRTPPSVSPDYIRYFLVRRAFRGEAERSMQGAVGHKRVPAPFLEKSPLPLAPSNEQRRIVEKIDELFIQIEAGEHALERAQKLLERYRQSVLNDAVTGELTRDWREQHKGELESGEALLKRILQACREAWEQAELARLHARGKPPSDDRWKQRYKEPKPPDTTELPELPDGWLWASPSQIAAFVQNSLAIGPFGSNLKVSDYRTEGVPLVFVRHIRARNFQDLDPKFITKTKAEELSAHTARGGDLLITKMGDPPGDACLYPAQAPDAVITADCIKLTPSELIPERLFLVYAVNSEVGASQIRNMTTGVAQQKVSLDRFSRFAFPITSPEEQSAIVDRVEQVLSIGSSIEDAVNQAARRSSNLRQSILSAAFAGKLVPQDPADEPASVLLDRIRDERAAITQEAGGTRAGRRGRPSKKGELAMVKKRAEINPTHLRDIIRARNGGMAAEALWKASELDIDDFYKQLREEVAAGHLREERERNTSRIVCQ